MTDIEKLTEARHHYLERYAEMLESGHEEKESA